MNAPALWYMCKYCMNPFVNLPDLNDHLERFHSTEESQQQTQREVETSNLLDIKPNVDEISIKHEFRGEEEPMIEDNAVIASNILIDNVELKLEPVEVLIDTNDLLPPIIDHSLPESFGTVKTEFQDYSAQNFDLSMLKQPKTEPVTEALTVHMSELDAYFTKDQLNQLVSHYNDMSPTLKLHGSESNGVDPLSLDEPFPTPIPLNIKTEKKKRVRPPKNKVITASVNPVSETEGITSKPPKKKKKTTSTTPSNSSPPKPPAKARRAAATKSLFSCCFCGEKFSDKETLKSHELDEGIHFSLKDSATYYHPVPKYDPEGSSSTSGFSSTAQTLPPPVAGPNNLFQCRFCSKEVTHRWSLLRHERKHTGEKRFRCQYCERPIDDKSALLIHERTHTGERPFKCQHCDATFARQSATRRHELGHLGYVPKRQRGPRRK